MILKILCLEIFAAAPKTPNIKPKNKAQAASSNDLPAPCNKKD